MKCILLFLFLEGDLYLFLLKKGLTIYTHIVDIDSFLYLDFVSISIYLLQDQYPF